MSDTDRAAVTTLDHHVGKRLRECRERLGLSIEAMAEHLACSAEDIRLIEAGAIRPRAADLVTMTSLLEVPVSFLFDELPADASGAASEYDMGSTADGWRLMKLFIAAPAAVRARILETAREMVGEGR